MEPCWGRPCLVLLCFLMGVKGQDFDLADALDDPQPTKKPSSDLYPKVPQPLDSNSGGNIYPRPRPPPPLPPGGHGNDAENGRFRPQPRPPAGGSGGGQGYNSHGDSSHGGDGQSTTYGNPEGNMVARIVSPIVSVVVVALVGAGVSYFKSGRRGSCMRAGEPETV